MSYRMTWAVRAFVPYETLVRDALTLLDFEGYPDWSKRGLLVRGERGQRSPMCGWGS
jgi:hypothetical protein